MLFLDELPEFDSKTLEVLRQPLEEKEVSIARLNASYTYPANFMLVAALNPCKCGYYPDRNHCHCSMRQIHQYLGKISRPLLDRIDICIETIQIPYRELLEEKTNESSKMIRDRIIIARKIQQKRYQGTKIYFNSMLTGRDIKKYCKLGMKEQRILEKAFESMNLSARAYHRILKVARTIADLDQSENIEKRHLCEAIGYRSLDKSIGEEWNREDEWGKWNREDNGSELARYFAKELVQYGVQIVSGLARGVDGQAHRGALDAKGKTYGVIGNGVDICYPKENYSLFEQLKVSGGILSEYPMKSRALSFHFPMRNRLIAGLSDGIFVIEAREKSGSLITVDRGLEQGKDIYALPGRVNDALSKGCNNLIQNGAKLVQEPLDIIVELRSQYASYFADYGKKHQPVTVDDE